MRGLQEAMRREKTIHEVFWTSAKPPGTEYCVVGRESGGWSLTGTVARLMKEGTMAATYAITTDTGWRTRGAHIEQLVGGRFTMVRLDVKRSRWFVDGRERLDMEGCVDIDLGASPVTNTLPIKRNSIRVGSKLDITAAWVRFPTLDVKPLKQSYKRVGARRFIYRSTTGFKAELELDGYGLVKRYGDYWTAV